MKFHKIELLGIIQYLDTLELAGRASRMRTKFKNKMTEFYLEFEEDYKEILADFKDNEKDMQMEINHLLMETVAFNEDETNYDMLVSLKYSILHDQNVHKQEEAQIYNRLCDVFELIEENK